MARCPLPPFHRMPPAAPCIFINTNPLDCKLSPAQCGHLIAHPLHTDILLPLSFLWHAKSSLTFLTLFKWSKALLNIKGFAPFYDKQPRLYPCCHTAHPLDPISYITYCTSPFPTALKKQILNTWPPRLIPSIKKIFHLPSLLLPSTAISKKTGRPLQRHTLPNPTISLARHHQTTRLRFTSRNPHPETKN